MHASSDSEFGDAYDDDAREIRGAILTESIDELDPQPAVAVEPNTTVFDAVRLMNEHKCGCICVTQGGKLVGIFSERDVLRKVVPQGLDAKRATVGELMTKNPETLTRHDKIAFALNRMHVGGFRHIPLVERGALVGMISIKDVATFLVSLFPEGVLNVPPDPSLGVSRQRDGG